MARAAIVGLSGLVLTEGERALLSELPPLGVILFKRNISDPDQLRGLIGEVRALLPSCLLMVDQEGGRVARLRPPHWREHPPAAALGRLHARDAEAGRRAAFLTGALIGADCAGAGFNVACAPVLDLLVAGASAVIGDRAYAAGPEAVAVLAGAVADGLLSAGVQPVGKHVPGHGRAAVDSHLMLPELDDVDEDDLLPFRRLAWLPWMMTAHVRYRRVDPVRPATLSASVLGQVVRGVIGYGNVLVSDDLSMQAVPGDPGATAASCLAAGCDVALHCSGVLDDSRAVLEAVGAPDAHARARLDDASALAARRRQALDVVALAAERAALLA